MKIIILIILFAVSSLSSCGGDDYITAYVKEVKCDNEKTTIIYRLSNLTEARYSYYKLTLEIEDTHTGKIDLYKKTYNIAILPKEYWQDSVFVDRYDCDRIKATITIIGY